MLRCNKSTVTLEGIGRFAHMRRMTSSSSSTMPSWHGTTIISVRKNSQVVVAGDGQVSMGPS